MKNPAGLPFFSPRIITGAQPELQKDEKRGKTPRKRNGNSTQTDPVEVYCRVRPLDNPDEVVCVKPLNTQVVQLIPPENSAAVARTGQIKEYQYTFSYIFDEYTSQKAIFDYAALPLVEDLIRGKNGLLFTYGITSSGKTYTMTGHPQDQGILPRCLDVLFNSIGGLQAKKYVFKSDKMNGFEVQSEADAMLERQKKDILPGLSTPKTPMTPRNRQVGDLAVDQGRITDPTKVEDVDEDNNYAVFVSYIEIYNNYVYDLLEELPYDNITGYRPPQSKILRTDSADNMYVMNCVEVEIKTPDEAFEVLYKGQKRRKVAHTALNAESSRSHSIFNIRLIQAPLDEFGHETEHDPNKVCVSQLSLVDLAGSERCHRTRNNGDRLKEAGNINQSLMVLRNCIELLRENQKTGGNKMVPYRDAKLTHLFKNYFDGDGKVRMVVCVNPKAEEYDETIHVMKFAELAQEVQVARSQQVRFDVAMTPGRRRLGQQLKEQTKDDLDIDVKIRLPDITYTLGPNFPPLEVRHSKDDFTLIQVENFLDERFKRRENLLTDLAKKQDDFRVLLVDMEKEYSQIKTKNGDLQCLLERRDSYIQKLEARLRNLERKETDASKALRETEKERRDLDSRLRVEKSEKDRLKKDFNTRLEMNNQHWERNLAREKRKIESEFGGQILEKQRKLNILASIVNENEQTTPKTSNFRTPAPKPRTYTTPGKIMSARSESDVSSVGKAPAVTPRTRTATGTISSAKSVYGINRAGVTTTPRTTPTYNPRHRRSKSSTEVWLDHKPPSNVELDTVLQPKLKKKKSVSKLEMKDTKEASKYLLTHQEQDSGGEIETKLIKGSVMPTAGGGTAVVFDDVETLKQTSPGSRKRRSSCPQPTDFDGEWTDVEERCNVAIEGHGYRKRSKHSGERESRV